MAATIWAWDESEPALQVARANLAGIGRAGVHVRMGAGTWYDALPPELRGQARACRQQPAVHRARRSRGGRRGEEVGAGLGPVRRRGRAERAARAVVGGAPEWLRPGGALLCEIGSAQGPAVRELAAAAGLVDVEVARDLAGHERMLVARRP